MPETPRATQSYNPSLSPGNRITRRAICPVHGRPSSEFLGAGWGDKGRVMWSFRCTAANTRGVKGKADHVFGALPDPSAPKTPADLARWVEEQRAKAAGVGH